MSNIHATFPCGDLTLEGEWHLPKTTAPYPVVVVCHPHPLYGGDMANNVVLTICEALPQQSVAAFRFNFRGVGRSEGAFGEGIDEQEDVKAALDYVSSSTDIDPKRVGLAGYSFGGSVAAPVAVQDQRVKLLALISPALADADWEHLKSYPKPKLITVGAADQFLPLEYFQSRIRDFPEPGQCQILPGADHFWWGFEELVAQRVTHFFTTGFNQI